MVWTYSGIFMQYHCITQNSLWPVFPQQQTQPNIHNLEGASVFLNTSLCLSIFFLKIILQSSITFMSANTNLQDAVLFSQNCYSLIWRATERLFSEKQLMCFFFFFLNSYNCYYYLFLVEDFSGWRPSFFFFFFFFEFNFRPSVGAWLPATGVKQRLVYANGQGRDAVTALSLSLSLYLSLSLLTATVTLTPLCYLK